MRALVVRVEVPRVACEAGTFEVTVVYAQKKQLKHDRVDSSTGEVVESWTEEYTKKIKRQVFATHRPAIGSWLEVSFA